MSAPTHSVTGCLLTRRYRTTEPLLRDTRFQEELRRGGREPHLATACLKSANCSLFAWQICPPPPGHKRHQEASLHP